MFPVLWESSIFLVLKGANATILGDALGLFYRRPPDFSPSMTELFFLSWYLLLTL